MNAEPSKSGKTIWAFDLGKGSIGEAVRDGNQFLHKASAFIAIEFPQNKKGGCESPRARVAVNGQPALKPTV